VGPHSAVVFYVRSQRDGVPLLGPVDPPTISSDARGKGGNQTLRVASPHTYTTTVQSQRSRHLVFSSWCEVLVFLLEPRSALPLGL